MIRPTAGTFFNLLKHLAHFVLVLWLVVTLLFCILVIIRGNPVSLFLDQRLTPELQENLKQIYGYDRTPLAQYFHYLGNLARGEFGASFSQKQSVRDVLGARIGKSLWLGGLSYVLAIGLTLLILMGLHLPKWLWLRRFCEGLYTMFLTIPAFIFATLFIAWLGVRLNWFPVFGSRSLFQEETSGLAAFGNLLYHSILPAFSVALPLCGRFTAFLNGQLNRLDNAPYIMSARGRGLSERRIFFNHKMRALLPVFIQLMGLYLPMIAGGALVIEIMYGWSGLGVVMMDAVLARDYPLLMGGCLWTAFFVIPGYELADYIRERLPGQEALT